MSLIVGIPAAVVSLVQTGLLQRAFHDGLYPALQYRAEAQFEEWEGNTGVELFETRPGLLPAITEALEPGVDPEAQDVAYEQWSTTISQYSGAKDVNMVSSSTAASNLFLRDVKTMGLQAGMSVNRLVRDALFKSYLSGQTVLIAATTALDTSIRVASLNGFRDIIVPGLIVRPQPVNPAVPLPIQLGPAGAVTANVVGAIPDSSTDQDGPGTLILAAAVGSIVPLRAAVVSIYAPTVIRASGGRSVDNIGPGDTLVMQQVINAAGTLRDANVPPHDDGFYHAHISGMSNTQLFADPVFQRLNQSLPDHVTYKEGFVGTLSGVMFFLNTESPKRTNSGTLVTTASSGIYAKGIGAEVVNGAGVNIGRVLITGKASIYERGLDESKYVSEAGINGKVGEFDIVNNGLQVMTERIRLIMRAPQDRLQQKVGLAWSITTGFPVPSDITAPTGLQRFKRALILEHSL
jgi:hypothetical protein